MDNYWSIEKLTPLLLHASSVALKKRKNLNIYEKHHSPTKTEVYTNADVEIENLFSASLDNPAKHCYFIGEESNVSYLKKHSINTVLSHTAFIVDPIDGTLNYLNNLPNWGISVGLVENNHITQGAVVLPDLREIFISQNNAVYYSMLPCTLENIDINYKVKFSILPFPKTHSHKSYKMFASSYSSGGKKAISTNSFHTNRSCVYSIVKTLTGSYFGYMGRAKLWDLAACIGLFKNANVKLYYNHNNTLKNFPFKITENFWKSKLMAKHEIVFAHNKEYAKQLLPRK